MILKLPWLFHFSKKDYHFIPVFKYFRKSVVQLLDFFNCNKFLSTNQHSFLKGKRVETVISDDRKQ